MTEPAGSTPGGGPSPMTDPAALDRDGHPLLDRHRAVLDRALAAIRDRGYWSPYPEVPSRKIYGEDANAEGRKSFDASLGNAFPLDQPAAPGTVGAERSPYGFPLDVRYPRVDPDRLLAAMAAALPAWRDAGAHARAGVCLEILARLNARSFELAYATMHTTGQAFVMAFQSGGTHAQDRGLEAVAYAYAELTRHPRHATWEKPAGKGEPLRMDKTFTAVPRGVALAVACNTFPNWNSYPGIFASLATGNPVVVKPHPRAVLPLAITVAVAREVLAEQGFDPNLVCLGAEDPGGTLARDLATRDEVRIIDFTGSKAFGEWLEDHARQAQVYTEKSGVNTVVVDSTDDFAGMCRNLAFSLSLYSGQMCTAPQNILVPRGGIVADGEHRSAEDVAAGIAAAVDDLLAEPERAVEITGAIANDDVLGRVEQADGLGRAVLASRALDHPAFPRATIRTPALVRVDAADEAVWGREHFGPVALIVTTEDTASSLELFARTLREHGSITASVYSTDEKVLAAAEDVALDGGVALSCNLTGGVYVNQSAAFSDFHATGANPAANACLTDTAFVAGRFRIVQSRRHAAAPPDGGAPSGPLPPTRPGAPR